MQKKSLTECQILFCSLLELSRYKNTKCFEIFENVEKIEHCLIHKKSLIFWSKSSKHFKCKLNTDIYEKY